ncbi:MAG: UvrB/UvrC motif-containing protein [Planctomycetota bacterium]|nr:UvrB/UvrC motif-containing protein [Planctomycetota bacterium]
MKCQKCNKFAATVHQLDVNYREDGSPSYANSDYCSRCAQKEGLKVPNTENFPQIISVLSKALFPPSGNKKKNSNKPMSIDKNQVAQDVLSCDQCGWTLNDFRQTSRLGCPNDYLVFKDYLSEAFERLHGKSTHVDWRSDNQLEKLENDLQQAIASEDYEACATLRDKINSLQTEFNNDLSSDG